MTNLFSIFDPGSGLFASMIWWVVILSFFFFPLSKWLWKGRMEKLWSLINISLWKEIKVLLPSKTKAAAALLVALFYFIVISNSVGLLPYVFTLTSHLAVTLSLSLPLWLSYTLQGWAQNTRGMLAHLVPQGTPMSLMPFMVLIELISSLIRPGTLAVRLAANLIAGHLLLTLLSSAAKGESGWETFGVLFSQTLLVCLEMAVAIIQSYVFVILSTLYSSEV